MPTLRELKKQQKDLEKAIKKQQKDQKKFDKNRVKEVKLSYHDKQKILQKAKSDGDLKESTNIKRKANILNKLIIKATDNVDDETDSEVENDAEDEGFLPIRETFNEVKRQLLKKKAINKKFRVQFKSYINDRINIEFPKEFPFNNINHYKKFLETLDKDEPEPLDSTATLRVLAKQNDALKYVKVNVKVIKGGCNHHKDYEEKVVKTPLYKLILHNPYSQRNNCGLKCIEYIFDIQLAHSEIRNEYKLSDDLIDTYSINKIYDKYNDSDKELQIIEESYNGKFNFKRYNYFLIMNEHYYVIKDAEIIDQKDKQTKRGLLTWDIETRPSDETIDINHYDYKQDDGKIIKDVEIIKSQILKDTLTAIYYRDYKSDITKKKIFETDEESTSLRKFINFLKLQANDNKHYNCIAHNSARFDHYFLLSEMSRSEQLQTEYQFRGYSIIGLQFCSHLFKDSYCFMPNSLKTLCVAFKIDNKLKKKDMFEYNGKEMTNEQLCFYKPELDFDDFLELKDDEPKYWKIYRDYCLYDCISLFNIWEKFSAATTSIIGKMDKRLLLTCGINSCNTIGSLSMKLVKRINNFPENKKLFNKFIQFVEDQERFEFVNGTDRENSQKTGGISHCCKPGHHKEEISSVDIASQYPASLMNMKIPIGQSEFVNKYYTDRYGFYQLTDLIFDNDLKFKPICKKENGESLNWNTGHKINKACLDTWMIKYLKKHYGLKSFDVTKGLVSDEFITGDKIFGLFISVLYKEKALQDKLKSKNNDEYNPALRETIKLFMNALTGKLNEEVHKYYTVEVTEDETDYKIGAINFEKIKKDKYNQYITAGVLTYSYSKRLLFEYIRLLPNNSDDVIHVETDSIYFKTKNKKQFFKNVEDYKADYPVALGLELGNIKIEKDAVKDTYFLGKKFYYIKDDTMKIKGIPGKTITDDGTEKKLIDKQLYKDIYNGKDVTKTFKTMKKQLFADKIYISSYDMTRTIKANCKYFEYETDSDDED